jgi:hypothetical protein
MIKHRTQTYMNQGAYEGCDHGNFEVDYDRTGHGAGSRFQEVLAGQKQLICTSYTLSVITYICLPPGLPQ